MNELASSGRIKFTMRVTGHGERRRIVVSGELDLRRSTNVEQAVEVACRAGARTVELDMREVTFIDSSGVREILMASRHCQDHQCLLSIIPSQHPSPTRTLLLLGLADLLPQVTQPSW